MRRRDLLRAAAITPLCARAALHYLMYPYAEFGDTVLDGRDPELFICRITSTDQRA